MRFQLRVNVSDQRLLLITAFMVTLVVCMVVTPVSSAADAIDCTRQPPKLLGLHVKDATGSGIGVPIGEGSRQKGLGTYAHRFQLAVRPVPHGSRDQKSEGPSYNRNARCRAKKGICDNIFKELQRDLRGSSWQDKQRAKNTEKRWHKCMAEYEQLCRKGGKTGAVKESEAECKARCKEERADRLREWYRLKEKFLARGRSLRGTFSGLPEGSPEKKAAADKAAAEVRRMNADLNARSAQIKNLYEDCISKCSPW